MRACDVFTGATYETVVSGRTCRVMVIARNGETFLCVTKDTRKEVRRTARELQEWSLPCVFCCGNCAGDPCTMWTRDSRPVCVRCQQLGTLDRLRAGMRAEGWTVDPAPREAA